MQKKDKKPGARVTLADVAAATGVGSATVDRVLNERGNVSDDIRKRVLGAARDLGLRRILPSTHHRHVRVNVILARPERPLITRMANEFRRQSLRLDRSISIHRTLLKYESPEAIAEAMSRGGFDAIIVDAPDHPLIHATIRDLTRQGRPIVTIISDVPQTERLAYAGIDHYKAGRSAAFFLGRMSLPANRPGKVVVLCHHIGFQAHAERIRGLTDQLQADAPHLELAEIVRGGDDPLMSEMKLKEAFLRHPETTGIYNAGAGNRGVVAAMRAGLLPRPPIFIGHELTAFTWASLRDGSMTLTIDQSPELQVHYALEVLMHHFGFEGTGPAEPPYVSNVPFVIYGPQNIPDLPPA
ncbi:LacI family DNA-binding transcriptional regulator [Tabrizicola sp.]|uniref:LacI family DNA-binding transcriptional regulator n=1 Tax=Tabrizicola sp. TaxID=2005166 RepID=UPI002FDC968F